MEIRCCKLKVKNRTAVASTKLILLSHPLRREPRRKRASVAQLVDFPRGVAVLYIINSLIEVLGSAPRSSEAMLKDLSSPQIQSSVDLGCRALDLDKVEMRKVEFRARLKRKPRTRRLCVQLGRRRWGCEWRQIIAPPIARQT
jgi:hypothetical protein